MTPIAAYFIFTASERERATQATHGLPPRRRPSLLDRVRTVAATIRPQRSPARPAGAA
jgi:hypothetical protein